MLTHTRAVGLLLGALAFSPVPLQAADVAVVPAASPREVVVQEGACLRWVWQEHAWYDDCWWRRNPYVGRQASVYRIHERRIPSHR
jgi:hypothetical protein